MNRRRGVTSDRRRRVETELEARGLLPIQGQWEVPSVADLLAGEPVTTRGYSWDYVPAWDLTDALAARDDVTIVKLFRARNTLAHAASWSPVEALSRAAAEALAADASSAEHRAALHLIREQPGIPGSALKQAMGWKGRAGSRRFQRVKTDLEVWCQVVPRERGDVDYHTHDWAWHPWSAGKIAAALAGQTVPDAEAAAAALLHRALGQVPPPREVARLLPLLRLLRR